MMADAFGKKIMPNCHCPASYYFRKAIRNAKSKGEAIELGLAVVSELEYVHLWIRTECGCTPPCRVATDEEAMAKWGKRDLD